MCHLIVETFKADGSGKNGGEWFKLTGGVISYDHPADAWFEDAVIIDFVNDAMGPGARVGVEISLKTAQELHEALGKVIKLAESLE